jgi:hypothetical protein
MTLERPMFPDRRGFLSLAAGASAVAVTSKAAADDDSLLVELEARIFEQYEGSMAFDDEIIRLSNIWTDKSRQLYDEALSREVQAGVYLTPQERWTLVSDMPECREHNRLCKLQEPFDVKMEALIKQMFAMPAHTAEGRRAKVTVLLGCILGEDWRHTDDKTEYPKMMARNLLIELIGGNPGEMLRSQFA